VATSITIGDGGKLGLAVAQIVGHSLSHLDGWPSADDDGVAREFGCCVQCCAACAGLSLLWERGVLDDVVRPIIEDDFDLHYAWWVDDKVSEDWLAIGWRETAYHPHHHLPRHVDGDGCDDD